MPLTNILDPPFRILSFVISDLENSRVSVSKRIRAKLSVSQKNHVLDHHIESAILNVEILTSDWYSATSKTPE